MTRQREEPRVSAEEATTPEARELTPEFYHTAPARWQYVRGSARWRDLTQRELLDALDWDALPSAPIPIRPGVYTLDRVVRAPTLADRCTLTLRMAVVTFMVFMALGFVLGIGAP